MSRIFPSRRFAGAVVILGIELTNVDKIAIGLGSKVGAAAGGRGTMYIDDIRLYRSPEQMN